jgi:DNA modification methylase
MKEIIEKNYSIYNADCIEVCSQLPDKSIGYSIFSPPFADLYTYSDNIKDMGNSKNYDVFFQHFEFLVMELKRIIKKGRHVSIHCMNIPAMKEKDGYIGIKDFRGDLIRLFEKYNFIFHSEVVIWKDPLIEVTRTKALGLLHRQIEKDSSRCRQGLPDYIITMRNEEDNEDFIGHPDGLFRYAGKDNINANGIKRSHLIWQKYASPVWMDIRQTNTLNYRIARSEKDEKHICPLQLDTIERCLILWSNPGDIVLSPFAGIGSEGYQSLLMKRKFIGVELKKSYFNVMVENLKNADIKSNDKGFFE